MHALIIDDDAYNLSILSQFLSMENIESTTVNKPAMLARLLPDLPPIDIVFLDLEMPNMTGYQIFEQMQQSPQFQKIPIVACTVHISEMSALRDYGFHSFIGKPIDADTFPNQLRQILAGNPVWQT